MASSSWVGVLRHGDDMVPVQESRDRWLLSKILLDNFSDREPVIGGESAERTNEDNDAPLSLLLYQTVFVDHSQGREL